MRFTIKTLSTPKGKRKDILYEIHCLNCKDINRDQPTQTYTIEAESAKKLKELEDNDKNNLGWRTVIMNCCKKGQK